MGSCAVVVRRVSICDFCGSEIMLECMSNGRTGCVVDRRMAAKILSYFQKSTPSYQN